MRGKTVSASYSCSDDAQPIDVQERNECGSIDGNEEETWTDSR